MPTEIQNAIIEAATIQTKTGTLQAAITLKLDGCAQVFGGWVLHLPKTNKHYTLEGPCGHFIWRVMEIAGVQRWEDLAGKTIRIKGTYSHIDAIGHIVKDDWFCPAEDFKKK